MILLENDQLRFRFPDVHRKAAFSIDLQRTLRIPDDGGDYPLPPGLGRFPLRHVDDFAARLPETWKRRGGIMLPMYQAEALWLLFGSEAIETRDHDYPFAVKIAAGKINAVHGEPWKAGLDVDPQGYVVVPVQPWLDGFVVEPGIIRQFVAMPLGTGYSVEEQLSGEAEWGGIQIEVVPMKRAVFDRRFPERSRARNRVHDAHVCYAMAESSALTMSGMGLGAGGRMRQEISEDPFEPSDWDLDSAQRCYLHLANSMLWRQITGAEPPHPPVTAAEYARAGLPWFDWYSEQPAVAGSQTLARIKSVLKIGAAKGEQPLPENQSVDPAKVVSVGPSRRPGNRVRIGEW